MLTEKAKKKKVGDKVMIIEKGEKAGFIIIVA